ncbi:MAG TPA: 2-dehydro-3-deoxy-D-gluconate 5-dehydrogenase KduD [Polyangiaceae bacterium]|nr:2-dehydro-3-deoxy-D-gluconate 5-dehydrogenase KduD [Polyangiaceae bacterium]
MALDWFNLEGKVALVTGSSTGIGAAIANGLARAGADVICHGRGDEAQAPSEAIKKNGRRSVAISADLSDREAQQAFAANAMSAFGRIDLLINNAGSIRRSPAVDYSDADWDFLLEVNLTAPFRLSRTIGKLMIEQGGGRIVNIASLLSFQGGILVPGYAASKGGVAQLTKALANEWASKGVNVNAIAPGYIATKNTEALRADPNRSRQILERIPAGRWGDPDDIAGAAVFLCSDAARYVTGHVLTVDGGWMGR